MRAGKTPRDVDAYIAGFPKDVQAILAKMRETIHKAAAGAEEAISYGIPTFRWSGSRVYIAGFKKHVSFFPAPRGAAEFKDELAEYKGGTGTAQFPLDEPIPYGLIRRMVKYRVQEGRVKTASNKKTAAKKKSRPSAGRARR